jgi:hypothetical protein
MSRATALPSQRRTARPTISLGRAPRSVQATHRAPRAIRSARRRHSTSARSRPTYRPTVTTWCRVVSRQARIRPNSSRSVLRRCGRPIHRLVAMPSTTHRAVGRSSAGEEKSSRRTWFGASIGATEIRCTARCRMGRTWSRGGSTDRAVRRHNMHLGRSAASGGALGEWCRRRRSTLWGRGSMRLCRVERGRAAPFENENDGVWWFGTRLLATGVERHRCPRSLRRSR